VSLVGTFGPLPLLGGTLTSALSGGGNAITNFDNGHTLSDQALASDISTALAASLWSGYQAGDAGIILRGLLASRKYLCTLGVRVYVYTDADHTVGGTIDMVIGLSIVTDGSSVATCTLSGTVIPDTSNLPLGIAGATATLAATSGGFIVSVTRKASTACHARGKWWVNSFEDVT
jgi:hypothetical protein